VRDIPAQSENIRAWPTYFVFTHHHHTDQMLTLLQSFSRLSLRSGQNSAGPSNLKAPAVSLGSTSFTSSFNWPSAVQSRNAAQLAPRRTKYRKAHKGRVPLHTGGSLKGTTLSEGAYGIRLLEPARLSAKQLQSAEVALKRKLKVIKGAQVFMRVFPDIPVCVKGNETRMGKGKGSFEFWACRATVGRVIFEIGGPVDIRPEVAKEALRLASAKLPVRSEFITRESAPRLGRLLETSIPPGSASARGGAGIVSPAN
jgi:ribosomal protein L16